MRRFQCLPLNLILMKVELDNNQIIKVPTEVQANKLSLVILIYLFVLGIQEICKSTWYVGILSCSMVTSRQAGLENSTCSWLLKAAVGKSYKSNFLSYLLKLSLCKDSIT